MWAADVCDLLNAIFLDSLKKTVARGETYTLMPTADCKFSIKCNTLSCFFGDFLNRPISPFTIQLETHFIDAKHLNSYQYCLVLCNTRRKSLVSFKKTKHIINCCANYKILLKITNGEMQTYSYLFGQMQDLIIFCPLCWENTSAIHLFAYSTASKGWSPVVTYEARGHAC